MMKTMIFVALGGAVGASLRYLVGLAVAFPLGTLGVNVIGSFAIGLLWAGFEGRDIPYLMPLLMTGVLGGFTTFSAFSLDTLRLMQDGRIGMAGSYVLASVVLSLIACFVGLWLIKGGAA
ncbi:MAG: CrcB protein [Candidatus Azotimanducaceae bacterium]|jgi:CrcB protein